MSEQPKDLESLGPQSESETIKEPGTSPDLESLNLGEPEIPSMAATSKLNTFGARKAAKNNQDPGEDQPEDQDLGDQDAGGQDSGGQNSGSQGQDLPSLGAAGATGAGVASMDLEAPGGGPPKSGNAFTRGITATFSSIVKVWKRIPPIEDIFDMILTSFGFQRKPASMLKRAQGLAAKGRYADAIKWFRDILYLRPLTVAAYDGLGRVYFRMGLTEEANREFTIADSLERLVNNRDDLDAACSLAKALLERKQAKMAISLLEPVLIAHFYTPNNSDLFKRMGLLYADLRSTKKLYQVYEAGLAQHPDDHEFYILKGNLDIKFGRSAEGEKLIRWGRLMGRLKDNPADVNALMSFGELCIKENRQDEGLQHLAQAASLSPDNSGIRWRLFNLYQKLGQYPEALRYFLEVVAMEPENEELKYKLADFYRKNRHHEEALEIYRTLANKHPRQPRPRALMASLLQDMGQFDEAQNLKALADTLTIGLKENPDHNETVIFMKYLFGIHQQKEAIEWLNRGLSKWPYHGELIITKVKILYNEYRYKEAVALLKRLISVKHDMAEPHMWMAMCYQRLGNHMAALAEAQLATRLAPKSFTSHKVLGDILKEQKKVSQANAAYEVADMIRLTQSKAANSSR